MKDLVINTAFCDMRSTREETLKKYASVTVNAAEVLVTPSVQTMLADHNVRLNAAYVISVPDGVKVQVENYSGTHSISGEAFPEDGTLHVLFISGLLTVEPSGIEKAKSYYAIVVSGMVELPRSLIGSLTNLQVSGSVEAYPDGALRLKNTAQIDRLFALRAKEELYFAGKRLVFLDDKLDAAALQAKGARFESPKALVAESLTESVLPLLDEQCDVEILPDGTRFIKDDAVLDGLFLRRNGKKAYVLGDVSVEDKESLEAMEYLHVHGELELPEKWVDILADKPEITYDSLRLQKERSGKMLRVEDKLKAMLTRQMLEEYPGGVILEDCAKIEVAEDVPAEWITVERVVIRDCAKVCGSAEQLPNLYLVCEDVAKITDGQADQEDEDGKDVSVINAASYTL